MKKFNTAGTCFPAKHYMVDISERLAVIRSLAEEGAYFCINRGRQYGKTTTLEAIATSLGGEYEVIALSFEGVGEAAFEDDKSMVMTFADKLQELIDEGVWDDSDRGNGALIDEFVRTPLAEREAMAKCSGFIGKLVRASSKPIVLLIDEVDQAGNHDSFIHFLGMLRNRYLKRAKFATFQSVILAGVYDVKNLKLKIRDEDEHQYNSPWNIAAPFDYDMSLSEKGIAGMLADYENDHHTGMDVAMIAKLLREYTSGYPFLVSRLCQLMDAENEKVKVKGEKVADGEDERVPGWNREGFLRAVNKLLHEEGNTLFDDLVKKLDQFPTLCAMLRSILYQGEAVNYNYAVKEIALGVRFGFIKPDHGKVQIANRIFETYLYNYFFSEAEIREKVFSGHEEPKSQFLLPDGSLDMPKILERFTVAFNEIYGDRDARFLEDEGRRYFMLYIKPIINGVGNYYIEPETRDGLRADMVIDYLGKRYVIEMKIWRGNSYNERGEQQLTEYLDRFQVETGYMVSFSFNKTKAPGLQPPIKLGDRTLIETLV